MIPGYEAYTIFNSVRLHFNQEKFDYFKYNGHSKVSFEAFDVRPDKYSFVKLGRNFTEQELPYFLAVNFYETPKMWIRDFWDENCKTRFLSWVESQKKRETLFIQDLGKLNNLKDMIVCSDNQFPSLLTKHFQGEITKDTLLILDHYMRLTVGWNKHLKDDFIWSEFYKKFIKYKPFFYNYTLFDTTLYKNLLKQAIGV